MRTPDSEHPEEFRPVASATDDSQRYHDTVGLQPDVPGDRGSIVRTGVPRMDGLFHTHRIAHGDTRFVSGGRQRSSGSGSADGSTFGTTGSGERHPGLRFDGALRAGGYAWWYIDGMSDDGVFGITAIAFLGSVFSPYYARRQRRGVADPLNHCAVNVALYGGGSNRWTMTERGALELKRLPRSLTIGPSSMHWDGRVLELNIDEICAPLPRRVRGSIKITPAALCEQSFALDAAARHRWSPLSPCARIDVDLHEPALRWSGSGYLDANRGEEPLENAFVNWHWSRAELADGSVVLYDVCERSGLEQSLALHFGRDGVVTRIESPPLQRLPSTKWRIQRITRADSAGGVKVIGNLEDAPFYSRTLLETTLEGQTVAAIHESLNLDRFRAGWVQALLPFRMPRFARRASATDSAAAQ